MNINKKANLKVEIIKVKKDITRRNNWGKWGQVRTAVLSLKVNETIKIGPFVELDDAYRCRNNAASGGVREKIKSNGCSIFTKVETEQGKHYCYVQLLQNVSVS